MHIEYKNFVQLLLSFYIHCNIYSEKKNTMFFSSEVNKLWFWEFGHGCLWSFSPQFSIPQSRKLLCFF